LCRFVFRLGINNSSRSTEQERYCQKENYSAFHNLLLKKWIKIKSSKDACAFHIHNTRHSNKKSDGVNKKISDSWYFFKKNNSVLKTSKSVGITVSHVSLKNNPECPLQVKFFDKPAWIRRIIYTAKTIF